MANDGISRRTLMKGAVAALGAAPGLVPRAWAQERPAESGPVEWVVTTQAAPWQQRSGLEAGPRGTPDVMVQSDQPQQEIEGFGACFNELGWTALGALPASDRAAVMKELFAPGAGACFTLCR